MKTWTSRLLVLLIPLCAMGVGDCDCVEQNYLGRLWIELIKKRLGGPNSVGGSEIFAVSVGDSGKILTSQGRPPYTWVERNSGVTQRLNSARFSPVDTSLLTIAVGNAGTILRSTNAGTNWSPATSNTSANLNEISFTIFQEVEAFAVGDEGVILKSTDGGNTWPPLASGTTSNLNAVYSLGGIVVVAGANSTIRRTSDGGDTWTSVFSGPAGITFNRLAFDQQQFVGGVMWVVGSGGSIYFSSTYGASWGPQLSNTTHDLNDVHFREGLVGVVLGNNGTVRHTSNGGLTWLADPYLNSLTTQDIRSASAIVEIETTTVGGRMTLDTLVYGVVITSVGLSTVATQSILTSVAGPPSQPIAVQLYQNYPNPFNPATRIPYSVQVSGFTSLMVYDVLGREVATLVNEVKQPGHYEVTWDADGLAPNSSGQASGVYFYKLQAGNFAQTKKLLLLR